MKRSLLLKFGILTAAMVAAAATQAQVVNFHNAYNYANDPGDFSSGPPLYGSLVYSGQGALSDPGNNIWNGFGGGFNPTSNGFSPGNSTPAPHTTDPTRQPGGAILTSSGSLTPITLTVNYGGDNGGLHNTGTTFQGTPAFILGQAAIVNGSNPNGSAILNNVASGTYNIFLYGENFDATRGAAFSLAAANGGTFLNGISTTLNTGQKASFVDGDNFVEVLGVHPDVNGQITIDFGAVNNPISGLSGEGDFNGLQLQVAAAPEPGTLAMLGLGIAGIFALRRRKK